MKQIAQPQPPQYVDVDASWDGEGSLDDHRQREFAKLTQVPFGGKPAEVTPKPEPAIEPSDATEPAE